MEIDFSPLQPAMNSIWWMVVKVLFIPFIVSMVVGLVLDLIKVPRKIVQFIAVAIFLFLFYQMILTIE